MSFSSHSLCFLNSSSLSFLVGRDRFKGFLQNLKHRTVARPVGCLFHLNDISQTSQADRRIAYLYPVRSPPNAFKRPDSADLVHKVDLQGLIVVHHAEHFTHRIEGCVQRCAQVRGYRGELLPVGGRPANQKVEVDGRDGRSVHGGAGVPYEHRIQALALDRFGDSRDNSGGVHLFRLLHPRPVAATLWVANRRNADAKAAEPSRAGGYYVRLPKCIKNRRGAKVAESAAE
ncbi:MAG TPA: hypothetical protein VNY05_26955 [Candidatus Acidoferrales bacterium]|nr:hypothetical protein [Candidatus Acidoferrales bacterium]